MHVFYQHGKCDPEVTSGQCWECRKVVNSTDGACIILTFCQIHSLGKNATIHRVTTMLSTSKNVLFHNHLQTTGADETGHF